MKNASICCIMESGARATANGDLSVSYALWVLTPLCPRDVGLLIVKSTFVLEWESRIISPGLSGLRCS
jgi:hypothetical protein